MAEERHAASKKKMQAEAGRQALEAVYDWIGAAAVSLSCVALVFTFLFRIVGVDGFSMENTLMDKDRLLLQAGRYTPAYGDIVVINRYAEEPLIKRVIALPGDTIDIDASGTVWINGIVLEEPYLDEAKLLDGYATPRMQFTGPATVPEGHLFVMGDHRTESKDSRSKEVGFIKIKDVAGKAVFRLWPLNRFGTLD